MQDIYLSSYEHLTGAGRTCHQLYLRRFLTGGDIPAVGSSRTGSVDHDGLDTDTLVGAPLAQVKVSAEVPAI